MEHLWILMFFLLLLLFSDTICSQWQIKVHEEPQGCFFTPVLPAPSAHTAHMQAHT